MCVFVALGIQNAMRMRHIVVCAMSGCTMFLNIISQTARFSKKKLLNIKCEILFSLKLLSDTFLILRRNQRYIYIYIYVCVCVCVWLKMHIPFHVDFNGTFLDSFSKNTQLSNFTSICPVGAKLLHADGHTDTTKLTVAFGCFANASKNAIFGYTMW